MERTKSIPKYREYEAHSVAFAVRLDVVGRRCAEGRGFVASAIFGHIRPSSGLDSSTGCRTRGGRSVDLTSTSIRTDSTLLFPCPSIYPSNTPHSTGFRLEDLSFCFSFFLLTVRIARLPERAKLCELILNSNPFIPLHGRAMLTVCTRPNEKLIECEKSLSLFDRFSRVRLFRGD